jgi:predicted RNA binding protein YcfA (HicA-like mRNA interferase family)
LRSRLGRLKPQTFREIERRLEAAGSFIEAGQKGSHVKFVRRSVEGVNTAIVPRKSEIPIGTLRSILSQAHISPDGWDDLR